MSIAEIIPAVQALSRGEKFQLAQLLLEDLAKEELPAVVQGRTGLSDLHARIRPRCRGPTGPGPQGGRDQLMSLVEQFPYCDRNPASGGLDLMPDLPIVLRHQTHSLSAVGLVDSGASISVLPYSLGVQLGFDWNTQKAHITLAGTLAHVGARGIVVEAAVGQLSPVRLALAWANSDQVPFLARTVQLLPGVRCLLFPHAEGLRDQATGRCEFSVKINGRKRPPSFSQNHGCLWRPTVTVESDDCTCAERETAVPLAHTWISSMIRSSSSVQSAAKAPAHRRRPSPHGFGLTTVLMVISTCCPSATPTSSVSSTVRPWITPRSVLVMRESPSFKGIARVDADSQPGPACVPAARGLDPAAAHRPFSPSSPSII